MEESVFSKFLELTNFSFFQLFHVIFLFQKIANGNMNFNEANFRIQSRNINSLLKGKTWCNGTPLSYF